MEEVRLVRPVDGRLQLFSMIMREFLSVLCGYPPSHKDHKRKLVDECDLADTLSDSPLAKSRRVMLRRIFPPSFELSDWRDPAKAVTLAEEFEDTTGVSPWSFIF